MGLSGAFGDQGYVCKACGATTALYSPHCPRCLSKTLTKVAKEKVPTGILYSPETPSMPEARRSSFPFGAVVGIVILLALYALCGSIRFGEPAPKTDTAPPPPVEAHAAPPARHVRKQPVAHTTSVPTGRARAAAAYGSAPARPAVPMRLWESSKDGE